MAVSKRILAGLVLGLLSFICQAAPAVLIIDEQVPKERDFDPNVSIDNYLAEELDRTGVLIPIVYSLTDGLFRSAVNSGQVKYSEARPTLEQALEMAKKLRAEYVIYVRGYVKEGGVHGRIKLFKGTRQVWYDPDPSNTSEMLIGSGGTVEVKPGEKLQKKKLEDRVIGVQGTGDGDVGNAARSLVSTWVALMQQAAFKGQGTNVRINTPDASQGEQPKLPETHIVPKTKSVDNTQLMAELAKLTKAGQYVQAVNLLHDAVDAEPLDVERRRAFVKTLMAAGKLELAAREARRSAELLPDVAELRVLAARAWMLYGNDDEAQLDLNEALARNPDTPATRLLLAELSLLKVQPDAALDHLKAVIEKAPSADAHFKRALCAALLGDSGAVVTDMEKARELGKNDSPEDWSERYAFAQEVLDAANTEFSNNLRSLMARAQARRTDAEVLRLAESFQTLMTARVAFFGGINPPKAHVSSNNRRILAQKLLLQCASDLVTYIKNAEEDILADARINLDEALKQANSARDEFRAERDGNKRVGEPS